MKLAITDEVELDAHVAAWLFANRDSTYLNPKSIPDEATKLGLVEGSFPDFILTEKGRKLGAALHDLSQAVVDALAAFDVQATTHPAGVAISFEAAEALVERLRQNGDT